MGQKQSLPMLPSSIPQPPAAAQAAPLRPKLFQEQQARIDCLANDVQLNMARSDLVAKDQKWKQCYPEQALQQGLKGLRDEATAYTNAKRTEQREANAAFRTKLDAVQKLSTLSNSLKASLSGKMAELQSLTAKRENLEQYERRERRAFLDNSPQSGTGGVPGVRTGDDRALLTFWVTYGVALLLASIFILDVYGAKIGATDAKSKAQIVAAVLLVAYGLAYYFISYYG